MRLGGGCRSLVSVAVALLTVGAAGCGGRPSSSEDPYRSAMAALCEALRAAQDGDGDLARQAFYDTAHRPLHDLAAETTDIDRTLAARLLEAKESVESALDTDGAVSSDPFATLIAAADAALTATGHDPVPCAPAGGG